MAGYWDIVVIETEIAATFARLTPNPYEEPVLWAEAARQFDATLYNRHIKSNPRKELYFYHRDHERAQAKARYERAMRERPDAMRTNAAARQRSYAERRKADPIKAARRREQNVKNSKALRARVSAFLRGAQWILESRRDR